jgi:tetratricopeptide (TPR) repeat protein
MEAGELERGMAFGRAWLARPENDGHAAVKAHHSRLCFRADRDEEAFEAVEAAARIEPDQVSHARLRFAYRSALQESTRLVNEFESIRKEWRDDAQILRYASRAYLELGLEEEAVNLAERNSTANPADDEVCAWLAELHDRCGRVDEARRCLADWTQLHGEQPAALKVRSRIAFREENYALALSDAEKVLGHDHTDEESFAILVRTMKALGRGPEARARGYHWLEHNRSSEEITRLLDEESDE